MSKTPVRMRRSSIDRNGNTPTAHSCLPFIYVDREFLFLYRRTTIAWNNSQLRGINHNPIAVVVQWMF